MILIMTGHGEKDENRVCENRRAEVVKTRRAEVVRTRRAEAM